MNTHLIHNEFVKPSAVFQIVVENVMPSSSLFNPRQLIVNRGTRLDIYSAPLETLNAELTWIHTYKTYATITHISAINSQVKNSNFGSIALCLDNSKIVIIHWKDYEFEIIQMFQLEAQINRTSYSFMNYSKQENSIFFGCIENYYYILHSKPSIDPESGILSSDNTTINSCFKLEDSSFYKKVLVGKMKSYRQPNTNLIGFGIASNEVIQPKECILYLLSKSKHKGTSVSEALIFRELTEVSSFKLNFEEESAQLLPSYIVPFSEDIITLEFFEDSILLLTDSSIIVIREDVQRVILYISLNSTFSNQRRTKFNSQAIPSSGNSILSYNHNYWVENLRITGGAQIPITGNALMLISADGRLFTMTAYMNQLKQMDYQLCYLNTVESQGKGVIHKFGMGYSVMAQLSQDLFVISGKSNDLHLIKVDFGKFNFQKLSSTLNLAPSSNSFSYISDRAFTSKFVLNSGQDLSGNLNFLSENFFYEVSSCLKLDKRNEECYLVKDLYPDKLLLIYQSNIIEVYDKTLKGLTLNQSLTSRISAALSQGALTERVLMVIELNSLIYFIFESALFCYSVAIDNFNFLMFRNLVADHTRMNINDNPFSLQIKELSRSLLLFTIDSIETFFLSLDSNQFSGIRVENITSILNPRRILIYKWDTVCDTNTQEIYVSILQASQLHLDLTEISIYKVRYSVSSLGGLMISASQKLFNYQLLTELPNLIRYNSKSDPLSYESSKHDLEYFASDLSQPASFDISQNKKCLAGVIPEAFVLEFIHNKLYLFILSIEKRYFVVYELIEHTESGITAFMKCHFEVLKKQQLILLFRSENVEPLIKFRNIGGSVGVFINIPGQQKMIFFHKNRIASMDYDNKFFQKNIDYFTESMVHPKGAESSDNLINGFILVEKGVLYMCRIPTGYKISEYGLVKRQAIDRFPHLFVPLYIREGQIDQLILYITVEKAYVEAFTPEFTSSFTYFLSVRTEE